MEKNRRKNGQEIIIKINIHNNNKTITATTPLSNRTTITKHNKNVSLL